MNRRKLLSMAASGLAFGLAGCTASGTSCGEMPVDGASHTIKATSEEVFIEVETGAFNGDDPRQVSDDKLQLIKRAIGASKDFTPVLKSDDFNRDGDGPYTGFAIHEDTSMDLVEESFRKADIDMGYTWWRFSPSKNWSNINDSIQTRLEAARAYSAAEQSDVTLPDIEIQETNDDDLGEQARWAVYGAKSESEAKNVRNALNRPTGLSLMAQNPQYTKSHTVVDPDEFIQDVDVVVATDGGDSSVYETQVTLDQTALNNYLENDAPDDIDGLRIGTGSTFGLHLGLTVTTDDAPVATTSAESWVEAFGVATSFEAELENPVYTNDQMRSCVPETETGTNSSSN